MLERYGFGVQSHIWLSAVHILGTENTADYESRNFNENVEWYLNKSVFEELVLLFGLPEIDMFASRLNKQVTRFVSWKPDPEAECVNAFSVNWSSYTLIYAFPPFSFIGQTVQKLREDKAELILVTPLWVTQNWYPAVLDLLIDIPIVIKVKPGTLSIIQTDKVHPLTNKLQLMACRLSGDPLKAEEFRKSLPVSLWRHGESLPQSNIPPTSTNGWHSVIKGKLVHFKYL